MRHIALLVLRHRKLVIGAWIALTVIGGVLTPLAAKRFAVDFGVPGKSAYEANQRTARALGSGLQPPLTIVVTTQSGDVTKIAGVAGLAAKLKAAIPGSRVSSYFATRNEAYVSRDRTTTFVNVYEPGAQQFGTDKNIAIVTRLLAAATPAGVKASLTGDTPLQNAAGGAGGGPSVLVEALVGGLGALVILLFVFGTLLGVAMPLMIALVSILTTFGAVWALTYATNVSIVVQFLVALVGLGIAIDYALLIVFRFREELAAGRTVDDALVETITHAGRAVVVSGSTVAVGLLSMILLPLPFIRSIGLGGMLIPTVSVLAAITLLPACLSYIGHRINRYRVLPRRLLRGDGTGFWPRWAEFVSRRPLPVAIVGLAIVALLLIPASALHPSDAEARYRPGAGPSIQGRDALTAAGLSAGVMKPLAVLVEGKDAAAVARRVVTALATAPGMAGAAAPPEWTANGVAVVEAFLAADGSSSRAADTISALKRDVVPGLNTSDTRVTIGGQAAQERDFISAVYGNFPYVLAFVVLLTYVLLARAFRSLILPLKAVLLNLVSLGAAYGIIVFVFQQGHGSKALFGVDPTQSVISWIPLMIFAFLYGISMDYEVFMLTRIREEYDASGSTTTAIKAGLQATGKLVTSAALILMFAFLVLSASPGLDIKQFGIGLAAGIIFDATVIRVLLVPALMRLLGGWNWWLPRPVARVLRLAPDAA